MWEKMDNLMVLSRIMKNHKIAGCTNTELNTYVE